MSTNSPITDEELAELRERLANATPGPWWTEGGDGIYANVPGGRPNGEDIARASYYGRRSSTENATFIAHAPTDIAALLARLDVVEGERDELAALLCEGARPVEEVIASLRSVLDAEVWQIRATAAEREVERLRAELSRIAEGVPFDFDRSGYADLQDIARAALEAAHGG